MNSEQWQQVERLYHVARERDAEERAAFLTEACAGDEELRREVESLLRYEDRAEDFIGSPALEVAAKIMADGQSATVPIAQMINQYKLISSLGAGGMGEVYLAQDTRLNRKVALKFLPELFTKDKLHLRRFEQEAQAVAALSHPNVCTIHEVIETEEDRHCIVMEYVDGVTLRQRLVERPMKLAEALDAATQAASALSAAHAAGIVHRDIKPENIMLRRDGYVKILDFGLAKLIEKESDLGAEAETRVQELKTSPGVLMGTVGYMSPEQARGLPLDARTDIWSLGVVLYEMVTGQKPFEGQTPTDVIISIAEREPAQLTTHRPKAPTELERIVAKALAKDRDTRYQTAEGLLTDLKNLRRGLEIGIEVQRHKPAPVRLGKTITSVLLALALLSVLGIAVSWLATRNKAIDSVAVLPFTNESADPNLDYLSEGITENLINRLSQVPELRVVPRSTVFRYKDPNVDPLASGRALGVRTVIVGKVAQRGDTLSIQTELIDVTNDSQVWGEQYNRRLTDLLTIQEDIATRITEKLRPRLNTTEQQNLTRRYTGSAEAYQIYLKGRYFWNKRTGEGMRKGIEYFRQAIDLDPGYSLAYVGLADSYNFLGAFGIALLPPGEAMPKAKAAASKALEIDNSLAEAHTSLAFISLYYDWDWSVAEREFQRAIELNPNYAPAHQWHSHLLMARGRTRESIVEAKRALELDPLSLAANLNLGWQYHWARQYDLAVEQLRKTLEMEPNFEQGRWGLGLAYEGNGLFEEAAKEFQKAMALSGGNPVYLASLGHAYAIGGRKADAMRILNELEERSKLSYVPPYWMATLCTGLGEKDKALKWLDKAHEERSGGLSWLGVDPRLDSLRSDARFAALSQRVGLAS